MNRIVGILTSPEKIIVSFDWERFTIKPSSIDVQQDVILAPNVRVFYGLSSTWSREVSREVIAIWIGKSKICVKKMVSTCQLIKMMMRFFPVGVGGAN
jgi:hypothetical protein